METYHFGLLGYPLAHSLSPRLHQAALKALGLSGSYELFTVEPGLDSGALQAVLEQVRRGELNGLNVTIPYKQTILPLLDHLTREAQAIGAVNTVYLEGESLVGDNTDAAGFLIDLQYFAAEAGFQEDQVFGGNALVLGAGGSARAIVHALLTKGLQVFVAARRFDQAAALADQFPGVVPLQLGYESMVNCPDLTLVVNATSAGMWPEVAASPWPAGLPLPTASLLYDLVYNPRQTALTRWARRCGIPATTGMGMLIEQAALSFRCWTGRLAPKAAMWEAVS
ncbi:MAG: shikimate dehydrogenase [Omnitrophica WOR_2 bacterium]